MCQNTCFNRVCNSVSGRNSEAFGIVFQNIVTKGVYCRDMCRGEHIKLMLKAFIIRLFNQLFFKSRSDSRAHLVYSRIGEGNDKHTAYIFGIFFVGNRTNNTFCKGCCFTRAGSRRNKEGSISGFYCRELLFCKFSFPHKNSFHHL